MSVTRINEFTAAEGKEVELLAFLKSLSTYISSSEGCLSYEVLQQQDSPSNFAVIEKWESTELHKKSVNNFPKEEMQAAMSLFAAPPKGNYYNIG